MSQKIKNINIKDLVLWTENPRDPINSKFSDQDFADRAIESDQRKKWSLKTLFKEMGQRFDQSEIPTVVYHGGKPVVYDGNRRVLIGKIIHGCVNVDDSHNFAGLDFPKRVPCNICDKKTALEHVSRKHRDSGSWDPLERDIFAHKHMGENASPFLVLENATKVVSSNPELNRRFVSEEIFDEANLHKMGFSIKKGKLKSRYSTTADGEKVLDAVIELVTNKKITTRKNRGKIIDLLKQKNRIRKIILSNENNSFKSFNSSPALITRKTDTIKRKEHDLFGEKLSLKPGIVNNVYSDLLKLYKSKTNYSDDFRIIIRMGLRLICELATEDNEKLGSFLRAHFDDAKNMLTKDEKTTLATQLVTKEKIISLLNVGAHGYTAAGNFEQTVALSLIIGKILKITHGKNEK